MIKDRTCGGRITVCDDWPSTVAFNLPSLCVTKTHKHLPSQPVFPVQCSTPSLTTIPACFQPVSNSAPVSSPQELAFGDPFVHYVDCGKVFFTGGPSKIDPDLMPDGIHPFAAGLDAQLACLQPFVSDLIANVTGQPPRRPGSAVIGKPVQPLGTSLRSRVWDLWRSFRGQLKLRATRVYNLIRAARCWPRLSLRTAMRLP